MAQPAEQERQAHHAVHDDHEHCEHGIARQCRFVLTVQHNGGNHRHLDGDHRQSEDQGAIGLAQPFGQTVGMADHAEGAPYHGREQPQEQANGLQIRGESGKQGIGEDVEQDGRRRTEYQGDFRPHRCLERN